MPLSLNSLNSAYVETFPRADGRYDWHLVAGNGEIVCGSVQGFNTRTDAAEAAERAAELLTPDIEMRHA